MDSLFPSDNAMDVLRHSVALFSAVFCLGCQQGSERALSPPQLFEMAISTISKHGSLMGAEIRKRTTVDYSNLVDVQNRLRSLDWQNINVRYEIEIIRREEPKPEAKLEIKRREELLRSTEFVFREDLTKPNDKTRVKVGKDMTADMVAIMTGQFFEPNTENEDERAK